MFVHIACAIALASAPLQEVEEAISLRCDGKAAESLYLFDTHGGGINYTVPHEGPFRWAEYGWHVTYRFPAFGARRMVADLRCGNRFLFEASRDGQEWHEVLREAEPAAGLSNLDTRSVDLTPHLGGDYVYLRLTHGLPGQPGFGGALFSVTLTREIDVPVPAAAATRAATAPEIDGVLDDPVWQDAQRIAPMWVLKTASAAKQPTVTRTAWDDEALYLAFECLDARPDAIVSLTRTRDGDVYRDAAVEAFLQPSAEGPYYHLAVNSLGTQLDERCGETRDIPWNAEWDAAARVSDSGWTAELRLPFDSLETNTPQPGAVWRVNLCRVGTSDAELCTWTPLDGGFHQPDKFGVLRFDAEAAVPSLRLEAIAPSFGTTPVTGSVEDLPSGARVLLEVHPAGGNPTLIEASLTGGNFAGDVPVATYGPGVITATVLDSDGEVFQRLVAPYQLPEPAPDPLVVTLRQPYYSDEPAVVATVSTTLEDATTISATLIGANGTVAEQKVEVKNEVELRLPLAGVPVGEYMLRVRALNEAGEMVAEASETVHRMSPEAQPSQVYIDARGVCHVNGEPFLPVIFYLTGGNEIVARAANTIVFGGEDPETCAENLDEAQRFGLMAMPHLCNLLRGRNDWAGLRATVSRNKNHPALLGWYAADEPEGSGDTPDVLIRAREVVREVDPNHPIIVLNNTPPVFAAYEPAFDVHMGDPYPIPHLPISTVAEWTDVSVRAGGPSKPAWTCLQTHNLALYGDPNGRWPRPEELRCMTYQSLIHGAQGIAWWCYNHARDSGNWQTYEELYAELREMAPYVLSDEPAPNVANDTADVHAAAFLAEGRRLVLLTNTGDADHTVRVTVEGIEGKSATALFAEKNVLIEGNNALVATLAPLECMAVVVE